MVDSKRSHALFHNAIWGIAVQHLWSSSLLEILLFTTFDLLVV
jgi:hypothetical protein